MVQRGEESENIMIPVWVGCAEVEREPIADIWRSNFMRCIQFRSYLEDQISVE